MEKQGYDREKLLKQFDRYFPRAQRNLERSYGAAEAAEITHLTRSEFAALSGRIPYIGGEKNVFTPVMVINGWIIALYRVMKSRGYTVEEVIRISYEASDDFFRSFPHFVDRLIHGVATTRYVGNYLRKQAERSQKKQYPEDFVYTYSVNRQGKELELELEFTECAVQKYYEAEGVEELKPYCNFFDPIYSKYFGLGVRAEETLGLGCSTCKLNYSNRRQTILPINIRKVVEGSTSRQETEKEQSHD